jgi:hypothetical protein
MGLRDHGGISKRTWLRSFRFNEGPFGSVRLGHHIQVWR